MINALFDDKNYLSFALFGLAVWYLLHIAAHLVIRAIQRRRTRTGNDIRRFLLIKLDALRFLARWGLFLGFLVFEGFVLKEFLENEFPQFYAKHSHLYLPALRHLKNAALIVVSAVTLFKLSRIIGETMLVRAKALSFNGNRDRERRAKTLLSVINGSATSVITILAVVMILEEFGVPIAPLLTGAGLAGLAVAFSAQTLIKDFFAGFFIILENQYKIGDYVRIGDRQGSVENVSLRTTILRDDSGALHIIPNGEIKLVTNMSIGWTSTNIDFKLPYLYDNDLVNSLLTKIATAIANDPEYSRSLIEPPVVVGLIDGSPAGSVYRVVVKTVPMHQARLTQEIRRQAVSLFSENGIDLSPRPPAPV